jgi:ATP-dependent Zn protease
MNQYLRRRVAYHEAGHAVISLVLSVPLKFVTIRPDGEMAGNAERIGGQLVTDNWDTDNAIVCFAGPIAEVEFCGKDSGGWFSWHSDFQDIRERLLMALEWSHADGRFGPNDNYHDDAWWNNAYRVLRAKTKRDAVAVVRQHKPAIECVAQALLRHETLTSRQVRMLMRSASGKKIKPFQKRNEKVAQREANITR